MNGEDQQQSTTTITGIQFLWTLSGKAKLVQEGCCLIGLICLLAAGLSISGVFYLILALGGIIMTGLLLLLYLTGWINQVQTSLNWSTVQLTYAAIWGFLFIILSFIVVISINPGYIIAGVAGFIAAASYLVDAYFIYKSRN